MFLAALCFLLGWLMSIEQGWLLRVREETDKKESEKEEDTKEEDTN